MQKKDFDLIVYIGRFEPPHLAHIEISNRAKTMAHEVLVLIGSANQPRTIQNPWTWRERADMIRQSTNGTIHIDHINDIVYNNNAWLEQVQEVVEKYSTPKDRIGIIGHSKDETSFYLKSFPQWKTIEVDIINDLHATDIRNAMFSDCDFDKTVGNKLPPAIHSYIKSFMLKPEFETLVNEYRFQEHHDRMWDMNKMLDYFMEQEMGSGKWGDNESIVASVIETLRLSKYRVAPYKPYFNTVDCVVIQSGHILLVRRRAAPGKGLFAIPGGYLNHSEWSIEGAIRELREETKIKVAIPVLQGNIKNSQVFEHPKRSHRGRIITHCYIIELPDGQLPKVKGSDDADKAKWIPLNVFAAMEDQMFEDHYHIAHDMISKLRRKK